MVNELSYVFLFFLLLVCRVDAILDGRAAPIYLDTRYTFTNYEWARGSVFFRQGFDVPTGGTVLLGIDGGLVSTSIGLNGGTLSLERNLEFEPDGYFSGSGFVDMKTNTILFDRSYPGLFDFSAYVKFLSNGTIQGKANRASVHFFVMTLDFRSVVGTVTFVGARVTLFPGKLLLSSSNPSNIIFSDCNIIHSDLPITFNNPSVVLAQNTRVSTSGLIFNKLLLQDGSDVSIESGSKITTPILDIPFRGTRLTLNNTTLEFNGTGTLPITIGSPTAFQGDLNLNGRCKIRSTNGNTLSIHPLMRINFTSGARLVIDRGTHVVLQS